MVRKCLAAVFALVLFTGGLFAQEKTVINGVDGTFKKFEGDKVTFVPDGAKDAKTCKINMESQVEVGKKTMSVTEVMKEWRSGQHGTFFIHNDQLVNAIKSTKGK
jgi:hypothetical protein